MKTSKITISILLITIFTISCSKDDEGNNTNNDTTLLLTKTTSTDGLISTYQYDANNRCINYKLNGNASNAPRDYNFNYNPNGTLDKITNNTDGTINTKYSYDTAKKITEIVFDDINVYTYTYNDNDIIERYLNTSTGAKWRKIYTKDANNNISEVKSYIEITTNNPDGVLDGTSIKTYDDKKTSVLSLPKEIYFPENNRNNLLTEKYNSNNIEILIYEYNFNGYPTKRTRGNEVVTYEYK